MNSVDCKKSIVEDVGKYRTKEKYNQTIQQINVTNILDFKETKGIKAYCSLNNLKYFHILDNRNVDIMHDLLEGTIPFLLKHFFLYCIAEGIFAEKNLGNYVKFFYYGKLNSSNIPSPINLTKKNLGQNASQTKCLFQHLPLIFFDFRENKSLKGVWSSIESMLKILQIVHSSTITKSNLEQLKQLISNHLKSLTEHFGCEQIPKHHFMTHYPSVIEMIGPIVHMSTLKYEMKHKIFTNFIRNSNNFINVSKSVCTWNQHSDIYKSLYVDSIKHSPIKNFDAQTAKFDLNILSPLSKSHIISKINWVKINNNFYTKDLILKVEKEFFEITEILCHLNDYYFVCIFYSPKSFNNFLQCVEIEKNIPVKFKLLKHSELLFKESHEKKLIDDKVYIISNCLEMLDI